MASGPFTSWQIDGKTLETVTKFIFLGSKITADGDCSHETKRWPPDRKSWLIWKDPDTGKDWGQKKKGITEDEMIGWHHQLDGHEFEQAPGVGEGQGSLVCCSPRGCKQSDTTEWLSNWTELNFIPAACKCREGNGTPLQYSCLENPMDRGVWWAAVHGVAKSRTQLRDFTFSFHFHALEKEMATHSIVLA